MNKLKFSKTLFFLTLVIFLLFSYRDFLWTYRSMLEDYFSYYHYQDQIVFYQLGDEKYKDYIPVNTRFLGLILQYIIFNVVPCLKLNHLTIVNQYPIYECATFSLAFLNYVCKYLFIIFVFLYVKKATSNNSISLISIILTYIFFLYLESFSFDRLAVLYILVCLYYEDKKYISNPLLISSFLVNEKVIMVLGPYYLFQYIKDKNRVYFKKVFLILLSTFFYIFMIFILTKFYGYSFHPYYNEVGFHRIILDFTNKSHISNSILPFIFVIIPYIILLYTKKHYDLRNSKLEILIPFVLWFLSYGGGENNIGRYVMHTLPLWLPLLSCQLYNLFFYNEKVSNNNI